MNQQSSSRRSSSMTQIAAMSAALAGAIWFAMFLAVLTAASISRGQSLDRFLPNLGGGLGVILVLTTCFVAGASFCYYALFAAQSLRIEGEFLLVKTRILGELSISEADLYRPVIYRRVWGGVIFFRKGSRTTSITVTGQDALSVARIPRYSSLPVSPWYEQRPRDVAMYESRLQK